MHVEARRWWSWPWILAASFLLVPPALFYLYPNSFWTGSDYEPLGLADALNMAYRIADRQLYFARGMTDHPGVPFYFMNWLALALTGYPVASANPGFLDAVIGRVDDFHQNAIWLGALTGAIGVYAFARKARDLVPAEVVAVSLLFWLTSTAATLLTFMSPSIDAFAILINGLFFASLVRLAYDSDVVASSAVLAACVGAFAYLNKLSYIYVPLALLVAGMANFSFRKVDWARQKRLTIITTCTFVSVVIAVGVTIIGWGGFRILLNFHKSVFLGSGRYGTGDKVVVSGHELWNAVTAIPSDQAYAVPIALIIGFGLVVGGFVAGRKGAEHIPVALVSIGAGVASLLSAVIVMKHYGFHYTAGAAATLPASIAACYLLAGSWGWGYRVRTTVTALAAIAALLMAYQMGGRLNQLLGARVTTSTLAKADMLEIDALLASGKQPIEFGYRAPFSWFGEGFIIYNASVPRLTRDYVQSRQQMFSSGAPGTTNRKAGAYVIDKAYFPTVESIKTAPNIVADGLEPVKFRDGDKIIELRTVFLLIPG